MDNSLEENDTKCIDIEESRTRKRFEDFENQYF